MSDGARSRLPSPLAHGSLLTASTTGVAATSTLISTAALAMTEAFDATREYGIFLMLNEAGGAIGAVITGTLIDRHGAAWLLQRAALLLTVSTMALSASPTIEVSLPLLFLMSLCAGCCASAAIASVSLLVGPEHRLRLFGVASATWGVAGICFPLLAAAVIEAASWRAVPWTQATLVLVAVALFRRHSRNMPRAATNPDRAVDLPGILLISIAALCLQLATTRPSTLPLSLPAGLLGVALLWRHLGRAVSPIFERRHLTGSRLTPYHVASAVTFVSVWGVTPAVPLVIRTGFHASLALGALALTLNWAGWLVGSIATARLLGDLDPRRVLIGGFLVQACLLTASALGLVSTLDGLYAAVVALGLTGGVTNNASLTLAAGTLAAEEQGRGLAALQLIRSVAAGMASGLAALLVIQLAPLTGLRIVYGAVAALSLVAMLVVRRDDRRGAVSTPGP